MQGVESMHNVQAGRVLVQQDVEDDYIEIFHVYPKTMVGPVRLDYAK
jgi:hypothetical protein